MSACETEAITSRSRLDHKTEVPGVAIIGTPGIGESALSLLLWADGLLKVNQVPQLLSRL